MDCKPDDSSLKVAGLLVSSSPEEFFHGPAQEAMVVLPEVAERVWENAGMKKREQIHSRNEKEHCSNASNQTAKNLNWPGPLRFACKPVHLFRIP